MQNPCHSHINRNPLYLKQNITIEYLQQLRRLLSKLCPKFLLKKVREAVMYCLTTVAVSGIFLGGVYLFLVQLANFGW
jgi:hypothetical protein